MLARAVRAPKRVQGKLFFSHASLLFQTKTADIGPNLDLRQRMRPSPAAHLPIPRAFEHKALVVPYLGDGPAYDRKGFQGFLDRIGVSIDELLFSSEGSPNTPPRWKHSKAWRMTVLQEWLWFGVLHEFELACDHQINNQELIVFDEILHSRCLDTAWLPSYMKRVVMERFWQDQALIDKHLPQDAPLANGQWVFAKKTNLEREITQNIAEEWKIYAAFADLQNPPEGFIGPMWVAETGENRVYHVKTLTGERLQLPRAALKPASTRADIVSWLMIFPTNLISNIMGYDVTISSDARPDLANAISSGRRLLHTIKQQEDPVLDFESILALELLYEALADAAKKVFNQDVKYEGQHLLIDMNERMLAEGWCPSRVDKILTPNDTTMGYMFSLLPSYDEQSHSGCSNIFCEHHMVNDKQSVMKHVEDECDGSCHIVKVPAETLVSIIEKDCVPGILRTASEEGATYSVCKWTDQALGAISHVWSHGLGNAFENALPTCQVEKLFKSMSRTLPDGRFLLWLDTLLIPREPTYRRRAIDRMRDIYRKADRVLVIDRSLLRVGSHWLERRMQLLASDWQRRLWTLQEARLAGPDLWIQFKDEAVPINDLLQERFQEPFLTADRQILNDLYADLGREISWHFERPEDPLKQMLNLTQDISSRTTTVSSDEATCLAILLGIESPGRTSLTMEMIYKKMRCIPRRIPFVPSEKLRTPGMRWAPSSLLSQGHQVFDSPKAYDKALLTTHGLLMVTDLIRIQPGIDLHDDQNTFMNDYYIVNINGEAVYIVDISRDVHSLRRTGNRAEAPQILVLEKSVALGDPTSRGLLLEAGENLPTTNIESSSEKLDEDFDKILTQAAGQNDTVTVWHTKAKVRTTRLVEEMGHYINSLKTNRWNNAAGDVEGVVERERTILID